MRTFRGTWGVATLAAGLVLLGSVAAQPPDKPAPPGKPADKRAPEKSEVVKPDPTVDAWVKVLAERMTDRHDTVRESARAGLVALGRHALPALRKLAESEDTATATAARHVIARIEHRGPEGRPGGPGFGRPGPWGRGPQGMGPRARGDRPGFPPGPPPGKGRHRGPEDKPGPGKPGPDKPGVAGMGPGGPPGERLRAVFQDLVLNDKQKEQIQTILAGHRDKMRAAFEKAREAKERPDLETLRKAMKERHEQLINDLQPVLTAEQMEKVKKALERLGPPGPFGRGPGGPFGIGGPPGRGLFGPGGPPRPEKQ